MKTRILMIFLAAVCTAMNSGCSKYELRRAYKPGKYKITTKTESEQEISTKGNTTNPTQTQDMTMVLEVSGPDSDGQVTVVMTVDRIQMDMPGTSIDTNDSAEKYTSEQARMMYDIFMIIKNMRLVMMQAADGKIISIEGLDAVWDEMAARVPQVAPMMEQLKQSFDKEQFTKLSGLSAFPDGPVGKGAVWHSQVSMNVPIIGQTSVNCQQEVIDIEDTPAGKIMSIKYNAEIDMSKGGKMDLGPARVEVTDGHIFQDGILKLNLDTGMLVSQKMEQTGDMKMAINDGGQTANMSCKLKQKITATVEKIE